MSHPFLFWNWCEFIVYPFSLPIRTGNDASSCFEIKLCDFVSLEKWIRPRQQRLWSPPHWSDKKTKSEIGFLSKRTSVRLRFPQKSPETKLNGRSVAETNREPERYIRSGIRNHFWKSREVCGLFLDQGVLSSPNSKFCSLFQNNEPNSVENSVFQLLASFSEKNLFFRKFWKSSPNK